MAFRIIENEREENKSDHTIRLKGGIDNSRVVIIIDEKEVMQIWADGDTFFDGEFIYTAEHKKISWKDIVE